jgi:hypothetical protein
MKTVDAKARISAKNILCATDVSPVRTDAVFRMAGPGDRSQSCARERNGEHS